MTENITSDNSQIRKIVETAIRLALLFLLLYWCFTLIKPFIDILLWAVIFSVALFPAYSVLHKKLGLKKVLSSIIIVIGMFIILALPGLLFARSLYEGVTFVKKYVETAEQIIPAPSPDVESWPLVGPFLYEKWNSLSQHMGQSLSEYAPEIKQVVIKLFSSLASAGLAFAKLIVSIIVSGLLLVYSDKAGKLALGILSKLIGERGEKIAGIAENAIRTVMRGILGVSFIQATLFGIGLIFAGVPAAGLWFILALLFSIIQIGIFPVSIPVIIYVVATKSTATAIIFLIWSALVSIIDNVLKPILLGRGAVVPMAVIFVGSIGGFIQSGLVGLFTGAIIFAVGYTLFLFWLGEMKAEEEKK